MKFYFLAFFICSITLSCSQSSETAPAIVDAKQLLYDIQVLSHDSLEGRAMGTIGNHKAQKFIAERFKAINITPAFEAGFIQAFPHDISAQRRHNMFEETASAKDVSDTTLIGGNLVAVIKGQSDSIIVVTAHLDHLGKYGDVIYNGADDDASGTAALLAIADYFKDKSPRHTLVIAAVDGEEIGSPGCEYLVNNFPYDIDKVVLNINMDMIAHNEDSILFASGGFHFPYLKEPLLQIESPIKLKFGHDDPNNKAQDDWTNSSDHRVFYERGIPYMYFGVEDHDDYHQPSDTFENINQEFYVEAVTFIIRAIESYDVALP
jgi:Zn-dependent M28 family amino/carboxypeptidase